MTITIECEWDLGDLVVSEIWIEGRETDDKVPWTDRELYDSAGALLVEVARWKKEQNRKQTERDE